ncbi:amidase [Kribbella speibonae]|uniref:Amidase n=1 Tax=Kribbella speibonae TaxID=1572660 RepID=A0A4R0IXP1_9ACTN|nr:amidase [Kribbella speibonae]TCC36456.1 amidase [Kribbella speibonae]
MIESETELHDLTAVDIAHLIRRRELSPVEVVDATLRRIDERNGAVNAYITLSADLARDAAVKAERTLLEQGAAALGPLAGVPLSIKDLTATAGLRTTFGLKAHEDYVPAEDYPVAARVRAAGAAIVGKSATPAHGWLGTTETEMHGRTSNPWLLTHTVGGSSGGSAAAVASGFGPLATGSDGGGSIRVPASLCGVVGHKPSHGRVPRGPESPGFETVDALGPMARTVADAALLLGVMAGPHPGEPYMLDAGDVDYLAGFQIEEAARLRVAFSPDLGQGPVDKEVAALVRSAVGHFADTLGADVEEVSIEIPDVNEFFVRFYGPTISHLRRVDPEFVEGHLDRYPGMRDLVVAATDVHADDWWAYSIDAQQRTFDGLNKAVARHDILLTPTMPVAAWPHDGENGPRVIDGQEVEWPTFDFFRFTEPSGHSGHPTITVPCGFTAAGLPVGLQIMGRQRDDRGVLRAAAAYEATTPWHLARPEFLLSPPHASRPTL